ncbi:major facilitator superfamily domain-containing protein [Xylogone sp. PMI_703]|nr:major facilitator superfamily domain-containing protein [Xylogone sp. PMI_703]
MADGTTEQIEMATVASEKEQALSTAYVPDAHANSHHKSKVERRLVLKADLLILPFAALIFFVAYLDRNSIGNARLMGIQKDLKMSNYQYYNCLTIFFVGYILFLLPANILLRHFAPHHLIGVAVIIFGALHTGMSASPNYQTVLGIRIFIGTAQAFIQGLGIYIGLWYKRDEYATRAALYYSAATISGAFSGLISYGVQKDLTLQATGRESWRWLFIVDGALALGVGFLTWLILPNFPDQIKNKKHWLFSPAEIDLAIVRSASYNTPGSKLEVKQIWAALKDPKSWAFVWIAAGASLGISSIGLFLPTFISSFGYSPLRTQLLTIIPSASATVTLPTVCFISDRFNFKGMAIIFCLSLSSTGYIILLTASSNVAKIVATSLVASGVYTTIVLIVAWITINTGGFTKRGTTWAMGEITGQLFSIMGTHIYNGAPRYIKGHSIVLAFQLFGLLNAIGVMLWMRHLNAKKDRVEAEYLERGVPHPLASQSLEEAYDYHPSFRYIL